MARIAFRLATAGVARCPVRAPTAGLVLQHLSQFNLADRPGMIAALRLDRGPGVVAIVPDGPAAVAGIRPGDVILAIDGTPVPPESGVAEPFAAARAHARADAVYDLLARAKPFDVSLLRAGAVTTVQVAARPACPSHVHLARSAQRNAYADGRHVFLTTGILSLLRNNDELAFIIAHEMAHNILGHAAIMRGATVKKGIGRTLGRSGEIVRGTESMADALGAEMMLDAGFDPVRGVAILTRLGGADLGIALLATHEPAGRRIAAVVAIAQARRSR
uniref:M48 family metalloprotease n=1 Tax=uncultured Sphingomonas sp. TaxID=158754 RepID=UPI0035CA3290